MVSEQKTEINILLLGETGVGKSTFINAFANYLNYETLEEAVNGEPICLIPTKFIIADENFEEITVRYGRQDRNENFCKIGQSVTQECFAYCFKHDDTLVRLIDTPGIGDTRGLEVDKEKFAKILSFIAEYKELHLICILMLPDKDRLTASFNYCLKELFCHLQKNASRNIVFLFTHTRPTLYRPKGTLPLIKHIVEEINQAQEGDYIEIAKHTMYCLDNDSFQFLIALSNNIKFENNEIADYKQSWLKSVKECKRLIEYITSGENGQPLPPHLVQNTLSINETRRLIVALDKPIAQITGIIDKNVEEINKIENLINQSNSNIADIVDNIAKTSYVSNMQDCLFDMINIFFPSNKIVSLISKNIKVFTGQQDVNELREKLKDANFEKEYRTKLVIDLKQKKTDLISERQFILKASAIFALFLKNNVIVTYTDSYKDYLLEQIKTAKKFNKSQDEINQSIKNLNEILHNYQNEKDVLMKSIDKGKYGSIESINALIKQLYELKETGELIKKLHEESKSKQKLNLKREVENVVQSGLAEQFFKSLKL